MTLLCPHCGESLEHAAAPKAGLTRRQADTLAALCDRVGRLGYSPTYDEIAADVAMGKGNCFRMVRRLADLGYVSLVDRKARGMLPLFNADRTPFVPPAPHARPAQHPQAAAHDGEWPLRQDRSLADFPDNVLAELQPKGE